jgi:uncharacterized UPF0146 family protein
LHPVLIMEMVCKVNGYVAFTSHITLHMDHNKLHWETVYSTRQPNEVSWTQAVPRVSLDFIHSFNVNRKAKIIDIGGGDSNLVDFLLREGFEDITVLDISENALERARARLGANAAKIKWIVSDVTVFSPAETYDVWHDRATFHFLTTSTDISKYLDIARNAVKGFLAMGTFSENGPERCSGLPIKQYSEAELAAQVNNGFEKMRCITEDHVTPFNTKQNFLFCSFRRNET